MDQERYEELEALEQYRKGLQPAPVLYRADGIKLDTRPGEMMTFVASDETVDRVGDVMKVDGWELGNFKKNPVFLYTHDASLPPIGTWPKVWVEKKQLLASPRWDEEDEFAKLIKGKYERGVMRAVSVGFRVFDFEEIPKTDKVPNPGLLFKSQELLEISAVAVPANQSSLRRALGPRTHFWIPFQMEAKEHITAMRAQLVDLRDEVNDLLKILPVTQADTPEPKEESNDWDEVLAELDHLVNIKGGDHV